MNFPKDIEAFITAEETSYRTSEVDIFDNYSWSMINHIQMSVSFKHGKFINASNEYKTKNPFKNIVITNLRLRYRAEDIDVKDIHLYIDEPEKHHLSFLVKKYHDDVFVLENDLDLFFDKAKEEKIDLGGVLVKKGLGALPEVTPLQSIAFCDQTDILGGPIGFKFNFSPDKLRLKAKEGWGNTANGATITIDELIVLAKRDKDSAGTTDTKSNKTTGKNIEVYVVRGQMPESYLKPDGDDEVMVNQVQVVAFYIDEKNDRKGQILYRAKEMENVYKFHNPEEIFNRALGFGGVEELFDAQIWSNFAEIHKKNMLQAGSKVLLQTDDEAFVTRNKVRDMDNLQIAVTKEGTRLDQIPTASPNIQLFAQSFDEWKVYAQEVSGATDALLGKNPSAGTPFRLQERVVFEGKGLHEYRQGKFAKFIEEIYRDWIIPHIAREIVKGKRFLSTLTSDEMQWLMEKVSTNRANKTQIDEVLSGKIPTDLELLKQKERDSFISLGNKQFLTIIKDELKDVNLKVKVNIVGKQKNLLEMTDKIVNVLRQYLSTPQLRQDPVAAKLLNRVLEASGMSPVDFQELATVPIEGVSETATKPIKELAKEKTTIA